MSAAAPALGVSLAEFVAIVAVSMALSALSVDIMLVALPDIAATFALADRNDQQFVITAYLVSFAVGQLVAGPVSDRLGRRPVILGGILIHVVGSAVALVADSFAVLLAARVIQGFGAAAPRVIAVAVVRDCFAGRAMSQVMSFVMTVFAILPIMAPAMGTVIAGFGGWRQIFLFLLLFAMATGGWVAMRLPETHPRPGGGAGAAGSVRLRGALALIGRTRQTVGYMLALGFVFACLLSFIATSQQLFADVYGIIAWFPAVFASIAGAMIVSTLVNARLVRRIGMRRLSHSALVVFVVTSGLGCFALAMMAVLPVAVMLLFLSFSFFLVGLILPNFNAIAMEPLGRVAGTGSSVVGFVMTGVGALFGGLVGQLYDGSATPLVTGFFVASLLVLAIVLATEGGRLFTQGGGDHASRE